ncbi:MAG: sensor domain-containing diguanylate cyclase [Anaerolineales bacterium]|nr:sensor domain-containing diguanylate cyclase [Anaerolineales bacterium]
MKTHTGVLREARHRLEQNDVPVDAQERLLELLNLLMTIMDDTMLQDGTFSMHLADVLADKGNLLMLIQRQAAELDALKRITMNLTSSLDLQAVLDGVVKEAMQLVKDAQDAHIYLFQEEKLVFGASLKNDGEKNVQFSEPRPDGLTSKVAREKKTIIVEDMTNHPLYKGVPKTWRGSIIGIPLNMGSRVVGVMNLARTSAGEFNQSEIRLLTLLADQAAIAIVNARLHAAVGHQARSDVLTKLPNRLALDERLDKAIAQSIYSGNPFCAVMMDLDGFKIINDTYGHEVGDEVLRQVATSMEKSLRSTDFLARYGGDEWTLVLTETNLTQAQVVIQKIQNGLRNNPIHLPDGKITYIGISGGVALYPLHADTAPGLIRAADEALYRAKKSSQGQFLVAHNGDA